jgi:hypothetical protein
MTERMTLEVNLNGRRDDVKIICECTNRLGKKKSCFDSLKIKPFFARFMSIVISFLFIPK